jgi:hypothetical protein
MIPRRFASIGALLAAALIGFAPSADAGPKPPPPVPDAHEDLTVPVAGVTRFHPPQPCRKLGGVEEDIAWAGWLVVHDTVDVDRGQVNIHVRLTLSDVVGVGDTSGWTFVGTGNFNIQWPPTPIFPEELSVTAPFTYYAAIDPQAPIDQCRVQGGLWVVGTLSFNEDGTLAPPSCQDSICSGSQFKITNR